jgi:endonuclease-3
VRQRAPDLRRIIERLHGFHGAPAPPPATEPFAQVVWENVGYLVDDDRRGAVYERLRQEVGIDPEALLGIPPEALAEVIAAGGMLPAHRAAKLQRAAAIALDIGERELAERVAAGSGHKLLRRFPGIGEPGADKIMLFARGAGGDRGIRSLGPDSNALRVLVRLGFGEEDANYTRQYRSAAVAVAPQLPGDYSWLIAAHQLLRRHGQELCRRTAPRCELCPLRRDCRWYRERTAAAK